MIDPRRLHSDKERIAPTSVRVFGKEYVWWAGNHEAENYHYIKNLNTEFARYKLNLILLHNGRSDQKIEYLKTMALRQLYVEVLESLFASLMAFMEAPQAIPIWLAKYTNRNLEACIGALSKGENLYLPYLEKSFRLYRVADIILYDIVKSVDFNRSKCLSLSASVCTIIRHAMTHYKNEKLIQEYNSIKHGHRATLGGSAFQVSFDVTDPNVRPDTSTFHTLVSSDSGITFPIVRNVHRRNGIDEVSLEDSSSTVENNKTSARIDALLRLQEVIYMAMSNKAGIPLDREFPVINYSLYERQCWMPEKYEGSVQSRYNYDLSNSEEAMRGWAFDISITRAEDPNKGIGAFTTDDTELLLHHILTKTFTLVNGWGFNISVKTAEDSNKGIGAFATNGTEIILPHILIKTFALMTVK